MQPVSVDLLETQVREQKVFICFFYQMSGKKDTINVKSYMTYETNVYRETYVKCTWTEIGCKWNVFASSLFLSMITMIFSVLIAMIWWWCWLRWCDDDVGGSDELWTKAATRATSLNISLSFPTNPSHNLHLHGWWWFDHHDNHLYFDDQWWHW